MLSIRLGTPEPTAASCCLGGAGAKAAAETKGNREVVRGWRGKGGRRSGFAQKGWGSRPSVQAVRSPGQRPPSALPSVPWGFPSSQDQCCPLVAWPGRDINPERS